MRRYRHPTRALFFALIVVAILAFAVAMSWRARHAVRQDLRSDPNGAVVSPP